LETPNASFCRVEYLSSRF